MGCHRLVVRLDGVPIDAFDPCWRFVFGIEIDLIFRLLEAQTQLHKVFSS